MKIILFTENYYRGGLDTFTATLINAWPDDDEFVLVSNREYPGADAVGDRLRRPCSFVAYDFTTYAGWAHYTRKNRVVNAVRLAASPLLRYLFLAHEVILLRKLFAQLQGERLLIINGGYPGGDACRAAGIAWGLFSGKPCSIHSFHSLATSSRLYTRAQENAVDAILVKKTKAFVTVSQAAAASMSVRDKIPMDKVSYIYNGIEGPLQEAVAEREFDIRRDLGLSKAAPLCLMLGAYHPHKGHAFLLEAFRVVMDAIPQAHFLMCGYGNKEEVAVVQSEVDRLGLAGRVHLLGFRDDAMELLAQCDVLLVGSQEFESFGLTCVEAMARRVPVVATKVGGLPEVVVDGEGGFCTERDDVDSYAAHVINLLRDEKLRKEQGEKGFSRYLQHFTAQRMAREYAELLKSE
ncbi:glycosyltransferase family 4 protein [Geomonas oryzisoli]|uniref:Glycosyltransferase family 4 protein n=1 Tax=Geomonas oryzisoli TaxID=2847992 RepID=A0ABX8J435_9BACT|nr:glycosyltransferase family 4 protein [Geomonas oryzisoli]QWV92766.1 glycosyltransferase family 4 protein [Geomonas oryzisoli]